MKKKFGIILAILLCVVLVLTFVACGGKKPSENKPDPTPSNNETIKGVTAEQVADMEASIGAYLDKWLLANAQDKVVDQTALLQAAMEKVKEDQFSFTDSDLNEVTPTIQVSFSESTGKYKVVLSWKKGAVKKTFEKEAKTVTYTNWAGKMNKTDGYEALTEEGATVGAIDKIVNAALSTVNKVGTNAQTAKFGVDGKIGLEVMGENYGLHIKGNVDLANAANTEIALMLEDEDGVLGGLYYQGAAEEKDCKIILQYGETYKYIDYAILNKLLGEIITPKAQPGEDFLPTGTLKEVLDAYEVDGAVSGIVASVIDMLAQGYVKEDAAAKTSTYLVDLNLNTVLSQVAELAGDLITPDMFEGIPYLEDLNISTMHGLLGHVTIAATVAGEDRDELTDFELAVNLPECTFYFNEDEGKDATKLDIPSISFALYLSDFNFITTGKIENVIPAAAAQAEYFSPTNFDIGGDIYIKDTNLELDDTFRFHFVSSVNPFKPSQAKGSLTITKNPGEAYDAETAKNFFTVTYEQASKVLCISGTVLGMEDNGEGIYTYDFDAGMAAIETWLGLDNWQGIKKDENGVITLKTDEEAKPAMKALLDNKLAKAILSYYGSVKNAGKTAKAEDESAGEQGGFSINKIGDYFNAIKGIYEDLVKDGVIAIGEDSASIEVTPAVINKVTDAINKLKMLPMQLPTDIKEPKSVKVYFNTAEYKDQLYVYVEVDDVKVVVLFDGSKENEFDINVTVTTDNRIYTCNVIAEDEGAASFTVKFKVTDLAGAVKSDTQVTFSKFFFNWGDRNDDKLKSFTAEQIEGAEAIFADDGVATNLVKEIVKFLNKDSVEPTVEEIAKMFIDVVFGDTSIKSLVNSQMK
ncbi:MAG: hypothetical protein K5753_04545 [Clostridia bacterium]|nr:hypothetical protein [Clostridia bacterium]